MDSERDNLTIYAGPLTNLSDARYFAAKLVDGLVYKLSDGDEDSLSSEMVHALQNWVEVPTHCGWISTDSELQVENYIEDYKLNTIIVEADHHPNTEFLEDLDLKTLTYFSENQLSMENYILYILQHKLSDFSNPVIPLSMIRKGKTELLQEAFEKLYPFIYGKPNTGAVNGILQDLPIQGIIIPGSEEEKVGLKDFTDYDRIFKALR